MEEVIQLYESISLPYKYCKIPSPDEPDLVRKTKRYYWVNQVIPNVAKIAFKHAGFSPTNKKSRWNASWGKQYDSEQYDSCKCWQKVNHFSGAYLIGRKDQLHKRMTELRQRTDDSFTSFYPKSYLIPEDSMKLQESWKKKVLWIVKPVASSRGRGVHVVSSKESKAPQKSGTIVQYYISRPFLITGRKFDIRLYALVTSVSPLRIYLHTSGLARFATHEYDTATPTDRHTHLTNFSVNKSDAMFIKSNSSDPTEEKVENSKWSLSFLLNYLDQIGIESEKVMKEIEKVTCMTIIAGMCEVRSFHNRHVIHRHTSFELYGIDVILDESLHPHIMEVNISPSLNSTDSPLDFSLKYPMVVDILNIARIIDCNPKIENPCPGMALIDKECRLSMAKGRTSAVEALFKDSNQNSARRVTSKCSSLASFVDKKVESSSSRSSMSEAKVRMSSMALNCSRQVRRCLGSSRRSKLSENSDLKLNQIEENENAFTTLNDFPLNSTDSINKTDSSNSINKTDSSNSINKTDSSNSINKTDSSNSINKADSSNSINKTDSSNSINKTDSSNSINKTDSSNSINKADSSNSINKTDSSNSINKTDSSNSINKADSSNSINKTDSSNLANDSDLPKQTNKNDSSNMSSSGKKEDSKPSAMGSKSVRASVWNSPVFADFVMIRDFVEEKQRMGGFRRIYPTRKTMDDYAACFSSMRYHDIVFGSWIKMSNEDRLKVLQKNWKIYVDLMTKIQVQLSSK